MAVWQQSDSVNLSQTVATVTSPFQHPLGELLSAIVCVAWTFVVFVFDCVRSLRNVQVFSSFRTCLLCHLHAITFKQLTTLLFPAAQASAASLSYTHFRFWSYSLQDPRFIFCLPPLSITASCQVILSSFAVWQRLSYMFPVLLFLCVSLRR